jgi:hypothetical protein
MFRSAPIAAKRCYRLFKGSLTYLHSGSLSTRIRIVKMMCNNRTATTIKFWLLFPFDLSRRRPYTINWNAPTIINVSDKWSCQAVLSVAHGNRMVAGVYQPCPPPIRKTQIVRRMGVRMVNLIVHLYWAACIKMSDCVLLVELAMFINSVQHQAFCCADILCYFSLVLSLHKDRKLMVFPSSVMLMKLGLLLSSVISMWVYSSASIAENLLLCVRATYHINSIMGAHQFGLIKYSAVPSGSEK